MPTCGHCISCPGLKADMKLHAISAWGRQMILVIGYSEHGAPMGTFKLQWIPSWIMQFRGIPRLETNPRLRFYMTLLQLGEHKLSLNSLNGSLELTCKQWLAFIFFSNRSILHLDEIIRYLMTRNAFMNCMGCAVSFQRASKYFPTY